MQREEQCEPSQRFLFAEEYFSDKAIAIWQSECIKRCEDKEKGNAYEKYVNWEQKENEIAIFTLYAYADIEVPKTFDTIFHLDNPKEFLRIHFELTQGIFEAWYPVDKLNHGHKHLCIFSFAKMPPDIFNTLHKGKSKFSTPPTGQRLLGFCNSMDFDAITDRIEKKLKLKKFGGDQ